MFFFRNSLNDLTTHLSINSEKNFRQTFTSAVRYKAAPFYGDRTYKRGTVNRGTVQKVCPADAKPLAKNTGL